MRLPLVADVPPPKRGFSFFLVLLYATVRSLLLDALKRTNFTPSTFYFQFKTATNLDNHSNSQDDGKSNVS